MRILYPALLGLFIALLLQLHIFNVLYNLKEQIPDVLERYQHFIDYIYITSIGVLTLGTAVSALLFEAYRIKRPWMWSSTSIKFWILAHSSSRLIGIAIIYSLIQHMFTIFSLPPLIGSLIAGFTALYFYYELWVRNRMHRAIL